jgi:hypothetical protein
MRSFTKSAVLVVALLSVMSGSVYARNPFFSFLDTLVSKTDKAAGIPTAQQAFSDFVSCRSIVLSRDVAGVVGLRPVSYNHSYRIDYTLNWDSHITNIPAMVVQMVVRYDADVSVPQFQKVSWRDTANKTDINTYCLYNKKMGVLTIRDKVFVYYLKTRDGWLYCGAESYLTSNAWSRMFNSNFGQGLNGEDEATMEYKPEKTPGRSIEEGD